MKARVTRWLAGKRHPSVRWGFASSILVGLVCTATLPAPASAGTAAVYRPLRVCADAQNLPYSNSRREGFENRLASLIAARLHRPLHYVWLNAARVSPDALNQGLCDVLMAEPSPARGVDTTVPYYWSSYVLLSRADRHIDIVSLRDHRLRALKVAVESFGPDRFFTPPARILIEEGLTANLVPFDISRRPTVARRQLIEAVAAGRVDVGAVWGPAVGQLATRSSVPLRLQIIGDNSEFSARQEHFGLQAMQYQISLAVAPGEQALRERLDRIIEQEHPRIERLLEAFGVPLISPAHLGDGVLAQNKGASTF